MDKRFEDLHFIGNQALLKNYKIAFLCSREVPASIVLKAYDWAIEQREEGRCVISGFHSKIEKDVFHYLLKGQQPVIMVLARGFKERLEPEMKPAFDEKRLLMVSPFDLSVRRITRQTAAKRNEVMFELADEIFVAYASRGGMLWRLVGEKIREGKPIFTFDVPENEEMLKDSFKHKFV